MSSSLSGCMRVTARELSEATAACEWRVRRAGAPCEVGASGSGLALCSPAVLEAHGHHPLKRGCQRARCTGRWSAGRYRPAKPSTTRTRRIVSPCCTRRSKECGRARSTVTGEADLATEALRRISRLACHSDAPAHANSAPSAASTGTMQVPGAPAPRWTRDSVLGAAEAAAACKAPVMAFCGDPATRAPPYPD